MDLGTDLWLGDKHFELFISKGEILSRIKGLAEQLNRCYHNKQVDILVVLDGAEYFANALFPLLTFDFKPHSVKLKTYRGMNSALNPELEDSFSENLHFKQILILEDIIETGRSLAIIQHSLTKSKTCDLKIACLFSKPLQIQHPVKHDFTGFEIGPEFVIGFGMDYNEEGRELPDIYRCINP